MTPQTERRPEPFTLRTWLKIGLLSSLSLVLFTVQVPLFAPFLKYDLSTVPALIAGFALGPLPGLAVVGVKNLLHLLLHFNPEELVGIPMRTIADATFVLAAASFYWLRKTKGWAVVSLGVGALVMTAVMIVANLLALPVFYRLFMPEPLDMAYVWKMLPTVIAPFNLVSGALSATVTFLIYKRFSRFLKRW